MFINEVQMMMEMDELAQRERFQRLRGLQASRRTSMW